MSSLHFPYSVPLSLAPSLASALGLLCFPSPPFPSQSPAWRKTIDTKHEDTQTDALMLCKCQKMRIRLSVYCNVRDETSKCQLAYSWV